MTKPDSEILDAFIVTVALAVGVGVMAWALAGWAGLALELGALATAFVGGFVSGRGNGRRKGGRGRGAWS